jgi:hypothetical protein
MRSAALRISAGALIPSIAAIIFNILNFFFENYGKIPLPRPNDSVFDFGVGCAFSLVGIGVTARNPEFGKNLFVLFAGLLLVQIFVDLIAPALLGSDKFWMIWISNFLSFVVLSWALLKEQ